MTPPFRLLIITDRQLVPDLPAILEQALRGAGADVAVMLREKDLPGGALLELAGRIRELTTAVGARLVVNDRLDVALAAGADGVHLPVAGLPAAEVKRAHPTLLVGCSTHSSVEAEAAARAGADYATFGPVYQTPSKRAYGAPPGLEGLRAARERVGPHLPLLGLGGIGLSELPAVMAAGATGVAAIRSVLQAPDPAAVVAGLLRATSCE